MHQQDIVLVLPEDDEGSEEESKLDLPPCLFLLLSMILSAFFSLSRGVSVLLSQSSLKHTRSPFEKIEAWTKQGIRQHAQVPPSERISCGCFAVRGLVGCFWANGEITHVPHKNAADTVETLFENGRFVHAKERLLSLRSDGGLTKRREERVRGGFVLFTIREGSSDGHGTGSSWGSDNNVARPNR